MDDINYYITKASRENIPYRKLQMIIKSKEYERLGEKTKNKLITNEELKLPDPILISSCNNIDKNVKDIFDVDTIGIIICARNNKCIIEYCSDERIFARGFKITN